MKTGEQMIGAIKIKDGLFIGDELAALVIIIYHSLLYNHNYHIPFINYNQPNFISNRILSSYKPIKSSLS